MIVAVVLAAGRGRRFSARDNKLLEVLDGRPLLRRAVDAALASRVEKTIVVTGFDAARIAGALADAPVEIVHNPDHEQGMASSLRAGLRHAADAAGLVVLLGDMPQVSPDLINRLIDAFTAGRASAIIPTHGGRRGNPVLLGRSLFPQIAQLAGDVGARGLLQARQDVIEVETDDAGVTLDVDTAQDFSTLKQRKGP